MPQIPYIANPDSINFQAYLSERDNLDPIMESVDYLTRVCHTLAKQSGWWTDLQTGKDLTSLKRGDEPKVNVPEKLMLIVSEIAEAMEGHRKNLADDKLPKYPMLTVELADAIIRILDLAGGLKLDIHGALAYKLAFNAQRADHKIENRKAENGKKF